MTADSTRTELACTPNVGKCHVFEHIRLVRGSAMGRGAIARLPRSARYLPRQKLDCRGEGQCCERSNALSGEATLSLRIRRARSKSGGRTDLLSDCRVTSPEGLINSRSSKADTARFSMSHRLSKQWS